MSGVDTPFSMDLIAWRSTEGLAYCKKEHLPIEEIRWANVGTANAFHGWHIDADGFGTFFTCNTGKVVVFVAGDREITGPQPQDMEVELSESSVHRFYNIPDNSRYENTRVEVICLEPGDTMYVFFDIASNGHY